MIPGNLKIVLIGLPGSGKTTLGKNLAENIGFVFYDLDECIEQQEQRTIAEVFSSEGEGYFRGVESRILEEVLSREEAIILSTGGGAPCFNDNMELINRFSVSVYLDVPLQNIMERLTESQVEKRPLFQGLDTGEIILKLKNLLADRLHYYDMAKIKLSGEDISTELLISELLGFLKIKPKRK